MRLSPWVVLAMLSFTGCGHIGARGSGVYTGRGAEGGVDLNFSSVRRSTESGEHGAEIAIGYAGGTLNAHGTHHARVTISHAYMPKKWHGVGTRLGGVAGMRFRDGKLSPTVGAQAALPVFFDIDDDAAWSIGPTVGYELVVEEQQKTHVIGAGLSLGVIHEIGSAGGGGCTLLIFCH